MFLDEKRRGEAATTADLFTLGSLITWLETKDPTQTYCYRESGHCLISQYFREKGWQRFHCGPRRGHWYDVKIGDRGHMELPKHFDMIASGHETMVRGRETTFGAALERARSCQ